MKKSLKALPVLGLALSPVLAFAQEGAINVVSREDGSGTRSAFVEIVGVVDENEDDMTTQDAAIQNSTNGVVQTVAGDPNSIGYISLGSLDDSVKVIKVDGAEATAEEISAGEYPIARPFNIAWNKEKGLSDVAQDFVDFINSKEGQTIVEGEGYIAVEAVDSLEEFAGGEVEGEITIAGSTSVSPVMEKLAEEYQALNDKVTINVTANGSSAGMQAATEGAADIGMASREVKDEEAEKLEHQAMAIDGIAVIVNPEVEVEDMSLENIKEIFLGNVTEWEDVK